MEDDQPDDDTNLQYNAVDERLFRCHAERRQVELAAGQVAAHFNLVLQTPRRRFGHVGCTLIVQVDSNIHLKARPAEPGAKLLERGVQSLVDKHLFTQEPNERLS